MIVSKWWASWLPSFTEEEQRKVRGGWYPRDAQPSPATPPPPPPPSPAGNNDRIDRLERRIEELEARERKDGE